MNGSRLMGLDSMGTEIYDIHEKFPRVDIWSTNPRFLGVTKGHGDKP